MAQHHRLAQFVSFVAQHKIVGAIVGRYFEATHFSDGFAAKGHGGAERKLHAFHHARHENARSHLHAHAYGLKPRPQAALAGHSSIGAAHAAHALLHKRHGHVAKIIARHSNVTVADDEYVVGGVLLHQFK